MLDASRFIRFFRLGSPSTPPSASGGQHQGPIPQHYTPGNSCQCPKPAARSTFNDGSEADYPPLTAPVVPTGASIAPFRTWKTAPILFYDKNRPYYGFTNFSPHDVVYKGKRYPTSEHLFQAFKFLDDHPEIAERIRNCGERPMSAFDTAHRYQKWVRPDWRQVNIEKMEIALRQKFTRHADLKASLLETGDAELIEDSPRDYFWGVGADHSGRNELGKALMRLRGELRGSPSQMPTGRKDAARFSFQDLTSLVTSQPVSDMIGQFFSVVLPPGHSGSTGPQAAPPQGGGLCQICRVKPTFQNHPYCGQSCATQAAKMCSFCHLKPRFGKHPYCSKTCAAKASSRAV